MEQNHVTVTLYSDINYMSEFEVLEFAARGY